MSSTPGRRVLMLRRLAVLFLLTGALMGCAPAADVVLLPRGHGVTPAMTPTPFGGGRGEIAFASYREGESALFLAQAGHLDPFRLTHGRERVSQPAWSPDGERLAFVMTLEQINLEIFTMDVDGRNRRQLTDHPMVDVQPSWSPNGDKIAFATNRDTRVTARPRDTVYEFEIYVMNADGSNPVNLTRVAGWDIHPAWSPDGEQIVFQSSRTQDHEIFIMSADGLRQTNLTRDRSDDGSPTWSPAGDRIAFHSNRDGDYDIYVMNVDGSGVIQLTNSRRWDVHPVWSPDGKSIAFYSERDGNFEIYVMAANGSGQTRWTFESDFDGFPAWRP